MVASTTLKFYTPKISSKRKPDHNFLKYLAFADWEMELHQKKKKTIAVSS